MLKTLPALTGMLLASLLLAQAQAQVVPAPPTPQVGSSNPVSPEPPIKRTSTKPCIVPLFTNQEFADFNSKPIVYYPPAACPGPWAKVVLTADFTVTAGRQFDRTAQIFLGDTNIFYGTTAEPRHALSPSWHVERDLTDYTALLLYLKTGQVSIGNLVDSTYTGIIYGTAALEFYPLGPFGVPSPPPDVVVPLNTNNSTATLNTSADQLFKVMTLPRNTEKVFLDVIAQSQNVDEFWYLSVPNDQTGNLLSNGNTAFRETEISIDNKPAGVAPIYPWIYTGGLDPYLWEPITGVQTLNFKPYRVDLTPFAGVLGDGEQHVVSMSVFNANSYFLAAATLFAYTDRGLAEVHGGLLSNNLTAAPTPQVVENIVTDASGVSTGTISVTSHRHFTIKGFVDTSHGRVETTLDQTVHFYNNQRFDVNANTFNPDIQDAQQISTVDSLTTTREGPVAFTTATHTSFPLFVDYSYVVNPDGSQTQVVTVNQKNLLTESTAINGFALTSNKVTEAVRSHDTLQFTPAGALAAAGIGTTTASYLGQSTISGCYSRTLAAANQQLTSVTTGAACQPAH